MEGRREGKREKVCLRERMRQLETSTDKETERERDGS